MRWLPAVLIACSSSSTPSAPPPTAPVAAIDAAPAPVDAAPDPLAVIRAAWPDGCFTAQDGATILTSDATRCALPRRPYSTFKIANALIALDAGVLAGADAKMTWDKKRIPDQTSYRAEWRRPHTLRSGIAVSAVPYFRTLALQLGAERMKDGLARLGYGNQDTGGGLDKFWLSGALRISADQQRAFMDLLARGAVPGFAAPAQAAMRDVLRIDERGGAILRGKTGAGSREDGHGGTLVWLVGWIETGGRTIAYAAWLDQDSDDVDAVRTARDARIRATFAALGWIAEPPADAASTGRPPITFTPRAATEIAKIRKDEGLDPGQLVRVQVVLDRGPVEYNLYFDTPAATDVQFETDGVKAVIDRDSLAYLGATEIDFLETAKGAGFKFNRVK